MKLRLIIFILLSIGMHACRRPESCSQADLEKQRLANQIRYKVATKLKQETELCPIGTIGQMLHDVQMLGLSFYYYRPVDITESRKLLIQAVNAMLNEVNQEKRIHPYLCRYPFLPRNVQIEIFLRNSDGRGVPPGNLWIIRADEGYLEYRIDHPNTHRLVTVYKETFDEALQRLAAPSLPLVSFEPDQEIGQEELARLRKGISLVSDDGAIWHLGENGSWVQDPRSVKK